MPVLGSVKARQHNFGRQSVMGTPVAAKHAYPFRGVPDPNIPNWTDPEVDVGSLMTVIAPVQGAPNITAALTDPSLRYNSWPLLMAALFGGGVTPTGGGTAKTWTYLPAVRAPLDDDDLFTYQFGDNILPDWFQLFDGYLERLEVTGPVGLGPLTTSMTWRFGDGNSTGSTDRPVVGTVPTPGITPDINEAIIYLKDLGIYIADSPYDLDANQITGALRRFTLRFTQARDVKLTADATQTFAPSALGRGALGIELEAEWEKADTIVGTGSESDKWLSDVAVDRYIQIAGESTVEAQSGIPYSFKVAMPARYYTRTEGNINDNATVILTARAFDDQDQFSGGFSSEVINTLASTGL